MSAATPRGRSSSSDGSPAPFDGVSVPSEDPNLVTSPEPPAAMDEAGRRLWQSVVGPYELEEHEAALLLQACLTVDLLGRLEEVLRREGPIVDTPHGSKAHPAAVEARQQRIALARLVAALRLPTGEEGEEAENARPQRRVGARGVYAVR